MEQIIWYIDNYTPQIIGILSGFLLIVVAGLSGIWIINRKKYQNLKHQIPAHVIKDYLDSIIQNSTSLKSSLFRGGGLDVGVPSVQPVVAGGGENLGVADGASAAELAQKNAEIAALRQQLGTKDGTISDLEAKLAAAGSGGDVDVSAYESQIAERDARIKELEEQLAAASAAGGSDDAAVAELGKIKSERDELLSKLQEYEIIEDDLANLKRLQQENEQLKKALEEGGGSVPAAEAAPEPAAEEPAAEEPAAEEPAVEEPAAEEPVAEAAAEDPAEEDMPVGEGEEKSAEDLLSEFEKMLG